MRGKMQIKGRWTGVAQIFIESSMPSTVVQHISYDSARYVLRIRFVSGTVYEYSKVPASVYEEMKKSGSKGTYLNQYIKGHYNYKKIH